MSLEIFPFTKIINQTCTRAWQGLLPVIFFTFGKKEEDYQAEISLADCDWLISKVENGKEIEIIDSPVINAQKVQTVLNLFLGQKLKKIKIFLHHRHPDELYFTNNLKVYIFNKKKGDEWWISATNGLHYFTITAHAIVYKRSPRLKKIPSKTNPHHRKLFPIKTHPS
jgi:hypothetical protein